MLDSLLLSEIPISPSYPPVGATIYHQDLNPIYTISPDLNPEEGIRYLMPLYRLNHLLHQ